MKYVKMLGLAAVAAAALMAFVGASTASATVLCNTTGTNLAGQPTGTTCPAETAYNAGTVIHAQLEPKEHATLTTHSEFAPDITCEVSTVEGKTNNEGAENVAVTGNITKLIFEKCNCEVKVLKTGSLSVTWISGTHDGTLRGTGQEITTTCGSIFGSIHCIYVTNNTDLGELRDPGTLEANSVAIERLATSGLCPTAPTWDAKYTVTKPTPLSVTGET